MPALPTSHSIQSPRSQAAHACSGVAKREAHSTASAHAFMRRSASMYAGFAEARVCVSDFRCRPVLFMVLGYTLEFYVMQVKSCSRKISCVMVCGMNTRPRIQIEYFGIKLETDLKRAVEASAKRQRIFASEWIRRALVSKLAREKARGKT